MNDYSIDKYKAALEMICRISDMDDAGLFSADTWWREMITKFKGIYNNLKDMEIVFVDGPSKKNETEETEEVKKECAIIEVAKEEYVSAICFADLLKLLFLLKFVYPKIQELCADSPIKMSSDPVESDNETQEFLNYCPMMTAEELFYAIRILKDDDIRGIIMSIDTDFDALYNSLCNNVLSAFLKLVKNQNLKKANVKTYLAFMQWEKFQPYYDKYSQKLKQDGDLRVNCISFDISATSLALAGTLFLIQQDPEHNESAIDYKQFFEDLQTCFTDWHKIVVGTINKEGLHPYQKNTAKAYYDSISFIFDGVPTDSANPIEKSTKEISFEIFGEAVRYTAKCMMDEAGKDDIFTKQIREGLEAFIDDNFEFVKESRSSFFDEYRKGLVDFVSSINSTISLYSFAALFYPVKYGRGKGNSDQIKPGKHLEKIKWKIEPADIEGVVERLKDAKYFPHLRNIPDVDSKSVEPARRLKYLSELSADKNYSWIKGFIDSYWPYDPKQDFNGKLNPKK